MFENLALPVMCAPMSYASSVPLVSACCKAGILGGWQGGRATALDEFEAYLNALAALPQAAAPPIVNLPARIDQIRDGAPKFNLLEQARVPLILCSGGDPGPLVERVHGWGGRIVQDVTTIHHAQKAIAAGVDGLMATCSGAGGHTGFLTPLAFVPALRRIWDGLLIVAGGIADIRGVAGALALGGDIACMGTRFIATSESGVPEGHRVMIARVGMDRIMTSAAMNGVPANWIRDSVEAVGMNPNTLPTIRSDMPKGVRPWRDVWSAGQSVGLIDAVEPVASLVKRMSEEFAALPTLPDWRGRLATISRYWATAA